MGWGGPSLEALVFLVICVTTQCAPIEQVHLALSSSSSSVVVSFVRPGASDTSGKVSYWRADSSSSQLNWNSTRRTYGALNGVICDSLLKGLDPNTAYTYTIEDDSTQRGFTSPPVVGDGDGRVVNTFYAVANVGVGVNASGSAVLGALPAGAAGSHVLLLAGDLACGGATNVSCPSDAWDTFGRSLQPLAGTVAVAATPGVSEGFDGFVAFANRFSNPRSPLLYYSFDWGAIHFVGLDTTAPLDEDSDQFQWLETDLKTARAQPWTVVFGSRPLYASPALEGSVMAPNEDLEELLLDYGVDLCVWGQAHFYERTYPVKKNKTQSSNGVEFQNPTYPIHVSVGTGGAPLWTPTGNPARWSAFRTAAFGYLSLEVWPNETLHGRFILSNTTATVDEFWVYKVPQSAPLAIKILCVLATVCVFLAGIPLLTQKKSPQVSPTPVDFEDDDEIVGLEQQTDAKQSSELNP
eukprot:gnl/Spiro4/17719_TR9437_c0_g1_i1.p1 gnl/Spiro4/17719_TR9437_c0_g1~~gnl/Spiro4/17719_TR9437_c0_g1_i1.p1  ORF type:complete len:476 (+),score=109.91 gnl/Spiro4/17719_TR9437_c0_g1_i1:32-1429(+)